MARTARKQKTDVDAGSKKPESMYLAGIYARLSVDAEERKRESIETQIEIAKEFIGRQQNIKLYDSYIDIGRTGRNFQREGFERMMEDVRKHRINCIVVKDLSRFGRNHIETGNYIERIFPFLGVRFIAVTDQFDSMDPAIQSETLGVDLKNLINEMYARDISEKVIAGKRIKREQGSYMGGIPPYGYRMERIENRNRLVAEACTSDIVKRIFDQFQSGKSMKEIIRWLYENGIVRPSVYHRSGQIYSQNGVGLEEWSRGTVRAILSNPVYAGAEALIPEEQFREVENRLRASAEHCSQNTVSELSPPDKDIFSRLLYCGACGSAMGRFAVIKKSVAKCPVRTYRYYCRRSDRIDAYRCPGNRIGLSVLVDLVETAIRQEIILAGMKPEALTEQNRREVERQKGIQRQKIARWERRLAALLRLRSEQYIRYRSGELHVEYFKAQQEEYDQKAELLRKKRAAAEEEMRAIETRTNRVNRWWNSLTAGSPGEKGEWRAGGLGMEAIQTFISRIQIYPDNRVAITFAFQRGSVPLDQGRIEIAERAAEP